MATLCIKFTTTSHNLYLFFCFAYNKGLGDPCASRQIFNPSKLYNPLKTCIARECIHLQRHAPKIGAGCCLAFTVYSGQEYLFEYFLSGLAGFFSPSLSNALWSFFLLLCNLSLAMRDYNYSRGRNRTGVQAYLHDGLNYMFGICLLYTSPSPRDTR